jgi:hypothetical protein
MPYNSTLGCIISNSENNFIPAQPRKPQEATKDLPRSLFRINNHVVSCIFGNHFFIAAEKRFLQRHRLRAYQINHGEKVTVDQEKYIEICALETTLELKSRLRAVQTKEDSVTFVICNPNGSIEMVSV